MTPSSRRRSSAGSNRWEPLAWLAERARFDCFLLAGRYTLLDQSALDGLLGPCERAGVSLVIGGVFNSGLLCHPEPRRALDARRDPGAIEGWAGGVTFDYTPAAPAWIERAQRLKDVCDRHATPLMAAAIQFPLAHPAVATVLVGPRDPDELEEDLDMFRFDVPPDLWRELRAEGLIPERAPVLA